MIAIAPASLDISPTHNEFLVTGGLVYLIGVGRCCFIRTKALREPDNRIKAIQFPHLFCVKLLSLGKLKAYMLFIWLIL